MPDLAVSLPTPTDGGRTYTFRLRPNIRYSNGRPVKASDFRSTFERDFKIGKLPVQYFDGIVGAARCEQHPKRCDLSRGIVADDAREDRHVPSRRARPGLPVQARAPVRLRRARGNAARSAARTAAARDRAVRDRVLPPRSTASRSCAIRTSTSGRRRRSRTAIRTGSSFEIGGTPDGAVDDVIARQGGRVQHVAVGNTPFPGAAGRGQDQHASQVHTNPQPATIALFLNTRLAPFDRLDVRRALNYAADRAAAVSAAGGPDVAAGDVPDPASALPGLPALLPLHRGSTTRRKLDGAGPRQGACPRRPLRHARHEDHRLVVGGLAGPRAVRGEAPPVARLSRVAEGPAPAPATSRSTGDSRTEGADRDGGMDPDYPAAAGFFNAIFTCASFLPERHEQHERRGVLRPAHRPADRTSRAEQATNPDAAADCGSGSTGRPSTRHRGCRSSTRRSVDVLSKRVGNYQYSPAGWDADRPALVR